MNCSLTREHLATLLIRLGGILVLSMLLVGTTGAQSSWSATTGTTPTSMSPGAPAGSYELSGFETVNLFNSRLDFDLPLVHVGGRGAAGFTVHLPIGNQWTEYHYSTPGNCGQGGCGQPILTTIPVANDWKFLPSFSPGVMAGRSAVETPIATCGSWSAYAATLTRLTFTAADGTETEFRDDLYDGQPKPSTCTTTTNRGKVFHTSDGSAETFLSDGDIIDPAEPSGIISSPTGYLMFRDGTRYRIVGGNVAWIQDANGNKITFGGAAAITDSLGRQINVTNGTGYKEISFAGVGGSVTRYIRVYSDTLDHLLASGTVQVYGGTSGLFPYLPNASTSAFYNPSLTSRVVLPDGRQYSFKYNSYGEMVRIDLPTGGHIEYDYAQPETTSVHHYVSERRVYIDGGITAEGITRYSAGQVDHLTSAAVLLSREKHYFFGSPYTEDIFNNHPTHYSAWNQGREWKTESYAADGSTLLRSVTKTWQQKAAVSWWNSGYGPEPPNNPRVVETASTLSDTNQVTKTTSIDPQVPHNVGFDQFNNPTDSWDYDYGAGAPSAYPLRHTHTDYLTTNPVNSIDYTLYTGAHIRSLPSAQKVYSVSQINGAETLVAQGTTSYDEPAYPLLTYVSVTGWIDPATTARGNATSTGSWLNTIGSWLSTHAQYDQLGNPRSLWDAKGNQTQISYTDAFSDSLNRNTYALATSTTSPIPDPTGVYGLTSSLGVSSVFDFSSGAVISSTDINGQTASLQYNDLLDRPTQLRMAVGNSLTHQTTVAYDDVNKTITTTTDVTADNDNSLKSLAIYDGLGRTIETRQYEGGTNYIAVQQKPYIALQDPDTGAWISATQSSNPFRPYLGETAVWTTTFSDALGRATKVRTPDNSIARTSYSGNAVTASDQITHSRLSVSDALGRLSKVYEDPSGFDYLSSYEYDALGNLTKVTQDTQPARTFVYDSLKRLASANNPESGTVAYVYDSDGNISQRTDARGIVTNYGYDAINRPITRTYSDGTPAVTTKYDAATGVTNAKGRLVSVASSVSTATVAGYDALGRVTGGSQVIGSQTYTMAYNYDLVGHVLSETYPSNHVVNYGYDAAARLSSFTGNLGDGSTRNYSTAIVYSSLGGLAKEQFGTATPVYNKQFYNSRGQLSEIRDSTSYTDPSDTSWNRGAVINHYSDQCWGACNGTDNNGNVKKQDYYIPDNEAITTFQTYTESFTYDNLNRLTNVSESKYLNGSGTGTASYSQGYTTDGWGNRRVTAATGGVSNVDFEIQTGTNRLYAPGDLVLADASRRMRYDTAGNLTTDNYTGAGARSYDAENHMKQAWANSQWQTYTYDAGGQRVKRSVNGVETWQVFGIAGELLGEYAQNGAPASPLKEYGYRNGQLLITATAAQPPPSTQNVIWTSAVGVSVAANSLTKIAGTGWANAGAASTQSLTSGDGYMEYTASETTTDRIIGLSHGDSNQNWDDVDFGLYSTGAGVLQVFEAGVVRGTVGTYATGDVLRVAVEGGVVKYRKNGALLYTSTVAPTYPLLVDCSFYNLGSTLSNVFISGNVGGGGGDIKWLVADQLGTPRMIFDKNGSLANTKRHDYLPFGEEIISQGGRDAAHGYGSVEGVRQKYTGYEHDDETMLDYAHARYYGSVQGRFTSPDPFAGSATVGSPQTFNRYAYVGNNPANLNDPTGLRLETAHSASTNIIANNDSVGSQMMGGRSGSEFLSYGWVETAKTGIAPGLVSGGSEGVLPQDTNPATLSAPKSKDCNLTVNFQVGTFYQGNGDLPNGPGEYIDRSDNPEGIAIFGVGFTWEGYVASGGIGHIGGATNPENPNGQWTMDQQVNTYLKIDGVVLMDSSTHRDITLQAFFDADGNQYSRWDHPGNGIPADAPFKSLYRRSNFVVKVYNGNTGCRVDFHTISRFSNGVWSHSWDAGTN